MKKKLFIALCIVGGWSASHAQTILTDTLYTSVIATDESHSADNETIKAIYEANGLHFQDPRAPRFLFLDRRGRVALGIGGYMKGTLSVDMGGIANNLDFVTADIPTPNRPDMRSQFQMDASTSRIFLKLVGRRTSIGDFTVYLESDFRGGGAGSYNMRLRQAYIQLGSIRAGRSWSTFFDPASAPPTVDFEGPSGTVFGRNMQLQYSQRLNKHWSFAAAIEAPSASYTTQAGQSEAIKQRLPDLPAYVQYEWDGGQSHIRLSGLLRALSYRNLVSADNKYAIGWAGQLSGTIALTPQFTLYYQAAYGRGYSSYMNDLSGAGYDLISTGDKGKMIAPHILGFVGGLQYNVSDKLFFSTSSSQCRLYNESSLSPTAYRYGQYMVVNAFYTPFSNCQLGVEYLFGSRHNHDRTEGKAHRINAMIQYNF